MPAGTVDAGSPLHALKGDYRLKEVLFKRHALSEAQAISLQQAANRDDEQGACLGLNLTMPLIENLISSHFLFQFVPLIISSSLFSTVKLLRRC